jgi:chemotaxis protein MotB
MAPALFLAGYASQSAHNRRLQEKEELQASNSELQNKNAQLQGSLTAAQAQITRLQAAVKYSVNSDLSFSLGGRRLSDRGQQTVANIASFGATAGAQGRL